MCFAGALIYYTLFQLVLWWFFHVSMLFWKVKFPFHARFFEQVGRMRYIHIFIVITALVVPVTPVIAAAADGGFAVTHFPPILCTGRSAKATFYSLILPIIVLKQCGLTMLIVVFWIIHKVRNSVVCKNMI